MEREIEIILQYEKADFFERMCLFLQFADLRDFFQEIEFKDWKAKRTSPSSTENQIKGKYCPFLSVPSRIIETAISRNSGVIFHGCPR